MINRRDFIKRISVGLVVASTTALINVEKIPNTKVSKTHSKANLFGNHRDDWVQESIKLHLIPKDKMKGPDKVECHYLPYYLNSLPRTLVHFTMREDII